MRTQLESSVTTVSWIPSESVTGINKAIFATGFTHFDDPPPDVIDDLEALRAADRFRFANHLAAWIQLDHGRVADAGYSPRSGLVMGSTTIRVAAFSATFAGVPFPELRRAPVIDETSARFVQTVGGHVALPAPRRVSSAPFIKVEAPIVWTTLELVLGADGRHDFNLKGASVFPRHWVYGADGRLTAKAGLTDFKHWWLHAFGPHTPWGDTDSAPLTSTVESALERQLATRIMRGTAKPRKLNLRAGRLLTEQGDPGRDIFLLLDGVVSLEVDGTVIAELGPGAVLGERAVLEGGIRTSTLRAVTAIRVAVVDPDQLDRDALAELAGLHRREERE